MWVTAATLATMGVSYALHAVVSGVVAVAIALGAGATVGAGLRNRATPGWMGVTGWAVITTATAAAVLEASLADRPHVGLVLVMTACAAGAALVVWVATTLTRRTTTPGELTGDAARPFLAPTTGLAPAVVGAGMTAPLFGAYSPEIIDSDSVWMTAAMHEVRNSGIELLQRTHDAYVPHLALSPLQAIDGHRAAMLFTIATMLGFVALIAYLATRLTGSGVAAFAASAALLSMPAMIDQVDLYPMYAVAFSLGYGSAWLLHQAMSGRTRSPMAPVAAGVGFVLAYESHSTVMTFLLIPVLLLILSPWRRARVPFALCMATIAVASIPRLYLNLSIGGFEGIRTMYNNTWFIQQGYLREINQTMFDQNMDKSPLNYASNLPGLTEGATGGPVMIVILAAAVLLAGIYAGNRARVFAVTAGAIFLVALVVAGPGTYSRYLTPLAAGVAMAVAAGIVHAGRRPGAPRALAAVLLLFLVGAAVYQMTTTIEDKVHAHEAVAEGSTAAVAAHIDNGRAVLGARSAQLVRTDPRIRTLSSRTMTEEDFVTFLSWPDDDAILELVERLDVGWVYVRPGLRFELTYHNTWLEPNHGLRVQHPLGVAASEHFCLATDVEGHRLYRYGGCRPGDEGFHEDLGIDDPRLNRFRRAAGLPEVPAEDRHP